MFAVEAEWLAAPQSFQNVQALVQLLSADSSIILFPKRREIEVLKTQCRAKDEPPVRQVVQCYRLPRQLPGTPTRDRCEKNSNFHALRPRRDGSQRHPGVR